MISLLFLFIVISTLVGDSLANNAIDGDKTIVWGPGLDPQNIVMRARYFFIHLVDSDGRNSTKSPGKGIVNARVYGDNKLTGYSCRIWTQLLDRKDGSFIIRYRLHETCFNIKFDVKINGKAILSDRVIRGPIYEEECNCPNPSMDDWMSKYKCPTSHPQMISDLENFDNVDFDEIREELIKKYDKPNSVSICHYVVKNNEIFRKCYGHHTGFKMFKDAVLLSLSRKVHLPDMEFFMNLGDWPLVPVAENSVLPIFSWCGSLVTKDIVLPTYDLTESSLEAMGRVMLDMLSVQGNTNVPWEKKIEKIFWRGRDSRRERLTLIDIARANPEYFNASLTNFFFFRDQEEKYGPKEKHESFFNFFKYKYQLNIDGSVAAYRFPYLLAGDAVVFKQDSEYYEFFYNELQPNVHYIPVKRDLSDLVEKVKWAISNDEAVMEIAENGRNYARTKLLPQDVFCYLALLYKEWNQRIKSEIKVLEGMEKVDQPEWSCDCNSTSSLKDEL